MNPRKNLPPELAAIEQRLGAGRGKQYWRSLEELANTEAFQELMRREFPEQASVWPDSLSRRQFLTLMGASLALAGLSGCSVRPAPSVKLTPYVRQPEELVPGRPLFFATAMAVGGAAVGLLVESHLGRPTKIEGNPEHPASLGATDIFNQASVLTLYDPDRSQTVTYLGQTSTWDAVFSDYPVKGRVPIDELGARPVDAQDSLGSALLKMRRSGGAGLRLLTETVVSPSLSQLLEEVLRAFPEARWHQYEPVGRQTAFQGARMAFGDYANTYYRFYDLDAKQTTADVVLSLDADFLSCGPGNLRYVAEFMAGRRVRTTKQDAASARMNRLYVVETGVSPTGAKADHRLAVRAQEIPALARAVAARLGVGGDASRPAPGGHEGWINAVVKDLQASRGRCVVLAGDCQPAEVHLLAHAMNAALGNVGKTVFHTEAVESHPVDQVQSLRELADAMDQGRVEMLVILGGNPVYNAPADFRFVERMQKVPLRFHLSLFQDETSRQCHWHLPEAHYLEAWGDTRAFDGTTSIVQPLIEPLYHGRSAHELLAFFANRRQVSGEEVVRSYWRRHWETHGRRGDFEDFWQQSVHDGVIAGTRFPAKAVSLRAGWEKQLDAAGAATDGTASGESGGLELVFQPDPTIYDGRFANNGWLQELPKPITKLTWDNAALMSPETARRLNVGLGAYTHGGDHGGFWTDVVELRLGERSVRAPVWIMPGHADHSITVSLGYGRAEAGKVGGNSEQPVGFDAYALRTSDRLWSAPGLQVTKTGDQYPIACTQEHQLMEQRQVVRAGTLAEYHDKPDFAAQREEELEREETQVARKPLSLYEPGNYDPPRHKWGMVIDLTTCTGCKACVVACQAENNIPVVGKDQVLAGREMHWLRIDRYYQSAAHEPQKPQEFYFQPIPCMHCEYAPCEYVCPVEATVHSADGLNEMVYQRCVGTRFCSNNCPYKVRRFNFFHYADYTTQSLRQQYNPDVTVRSRGVMEKCSYCVQRIRHAEIDAENDGREVLDGEVLTACQAACPAEAIVFGNLNDDRSKVKAWKETPLHYGLLEDLNTKPRTTYLAALRNPNPDLEPKGSSTKEGT